MNSISPDSNKRPVAATVFAICGKDRKFVWASARIVGKNQVEVWAEGVTPTQVRYAWAVNQFAP